MAQVKHLPGVQVPHEGLQDLCTLRDGAKCKHFKNVQRIKYMMKRGQVTLCRQHLVSSTARVDEHEQGLHQRRWDGTDDERLCLTAVLQEEEEKKKTRRDDFKVQLVVKEEIPVVI